MDSPIPEPRTLVRHLDDSLLKAPGLGRRFRLVTKRIAT
jgi:hypothetical protein